MTQPECFTAGHNFPRCLASQELLRFITNTSNPQKTHKHILPQKMQPETRHYAREGYYKACFGLLRRKKSTTWFVPKKKKQSNPQNNQKKQPTFRQFGFPAKCRVRNECGKSTLMTCHYPDLGSVVFLIGRAAREINLPKPIRSTTQIWVVTRLQYRISAARSSDVNSWGEPPRNVGRLLRLSLDWVVGNPL